jgi:hypothetical protein
MRLRDVAVLAVTGLCAACGSDSGPGPQAEALPGTWIATQVEFVKVASPGTAVDIVPNGGSLALGLAVDGSFSEELTLPGQAAWVMAGTWHASIDVLTLTYAVGRAGDSQFELELSGDTLTLRGANTDFAFEAGGSAEPAKLNLVLARDQSS